MTEFTGTMRALEGDTYVPMVQAHRLFVNTQDDLGVTRVMESALKGFEVKVFPEENLEEVLAQLPPKGNEAICKGCGGGFTSVEGFRHFCHECDSPC